MKPPDYPGTSTDFADQGEPVTVEDLRTEITRLQSEIDRLLDENADLKWSLGVKSEPGEPFC